MGARVLLGQRAFATRRLSGNTARVAHYSLQSALRQVGREWQRRINANLYADGCGQRIPYPELLLDEGEEEHVGKKGKGGKKGC